MPMLTGSLDDTEQSIMRPAIQDVVRQLKDITKLPTDTHVLFTGDVAAAIQRGSVVKEVDRRPTLPNSKKVTITVEEQPDEEQILANAVGNQGRPALFYDAALGIVLNTLYRWTTLKIDIKFQSSSRTEVSSWYHQMTLAVAQGRRALIHDLRYQYSVPWNVLSLLEILHFLREQKGGYGEDFLTYLTTHTDPGLTLAGDIAGKNAMLAIAERQVRVLGTFDFAPLPEKPERDADHGTYQVSFSYTVLYQKPYAYRLHYPVMVHNQLIPEEFVTNGSIYPNELSQSTQYSASAQALQPFEAATRFKRYLDQFEYFRLPNFDDFRPKEVPPATGTILIALCSYSEETPTELINLNNLGEVALDPDVLAFLTGGEYAFLKTLYESFLHVSVYCNEALLPATAYEITEDLLVRLIEPFDVRKSYRVRLGVALDIYRLTDAAGERLKAAPKALVAILGTMNRIFRECGALTGLVTKRYITKDDLNRFLREALHYAVGAKDRYRAGISIPVLVGETGQAKIYGTGSRPTQELQIHPLNPFKNINPALVERLRREATAPKNIQLSWILTQAASST